MYILILDRDRERRSALAGELGRILPDWVRYDFGSQDEVFSRIPSPAYKAAFLEVDTVLDLEAVRQLVRVSPRLPLVITGESGEYAIECHHIGVRHYLCNPAGQTVLEEALRRCGLEKQ